MNIKKIKFLMERIESNKRLTDTEYRQKYQDLFNEDFPDAAFHGYKMKPSQMRTNTCSTDWESPDDDTGCPQFSDDLKISKEDEEKAIEYLNTEDIQTLIAYSRGGAILLQALSKGAKKPKNIYLVAPAWKRQWPAIQLTGKEVSGISGVIIHGVDDNIVPLKHSVILAKNSGLPLYVIPNADHVSILKNKTNPMAGIEVKNLNELIETLPDWGETGKASEDELKKQKEVISTMK